MPPPLNIFPSENRISAYIQARKQVKWKMFTEDEMNKIKELRGLIKRLKVSYLRERKLSHIGDAASLTCFEDFKQTLCSKTGTVAANVRHIQKKTEDFIATKNRVKVGAAAAEESIEEKIQKNTYMQRYKMAPGKLFDTAEKGLASFFSKSKSE